MPRAATSKVWNEDLVRAFTVRRRDDHERGERTACWDDDITAITAGRKDIYEQKCKEGGTKIVNKPKNLSVRGAQLLENLVRGSALIVPPGMERHGEQETPKGGVR